MSYNLQNSARQSSNGSLQEHYEMNKLRQQYYQLVLQVQTLQKHIFKIQTQKQVEYKHFNDQTQKLKLYIDQCQNQIKKRQQRQIIFIQRIKELEQLSYMKNDSALLASRNMEQVTNRNIQQVKNIQQMAAQYQHQIQQITNKYQTTISAQMNQWNEERAAMIKDNQHLMRTNIELGKKVTLLNQNSRESQQTIKILNENIILFKENIKQLSLVKTDFQSRLEQKDRYLQIQKLSFQSLQKNFQQSVGPLKKQLQQLHDQNQHLRIQILQRKNQIQYYKHEIQSLKYLNQTQKYQFQQKLIELSQRQTLQQQKPALSISSSCSNCLRLNKIHAQEMERCKVEILSLRKDIECLMAFFQCNE